MRWFLFLCLIPLTSASVSLCPQNLPNTCSCECYICDREPVFLTMYCSTVPDLYELLSIIGTVKYFEVKIDKCDKPVQNLTKLPPFYTIRLFINHCGLESVADDAFVDIAKLELLDLSNNAITRMPVFPPFPLLTYIALNHNLLRDFGEPSATKNYSSFDGVQELIQIYLQNNSFTEITNASFPNLNALRIIDLSNNKLNCIASDAFQSLHGIINLNISFNELTYLEPETFKNMNVYTNLYLNNNRLTKLSANSFVGNKYLQTIDLQNNQLDEISLGTFNDLGELTEIRFSNNNLTYIDGIFNNLPKLRNINLSKNFVHITNTTFSGLGKISLDLSNNHIKSIPPNAFQNVFELILDDNRLSTMDGVFGKDNCLQHLFFSNNSFTQIKNTTFYHLTKLWELSLAHNKINYIEPYSFAQTVLYSLDISYNNLTTLEPFSTFVKNGPPHKLVYKGNQFICDENLKWFTEYLKYNVSNGRGYYFANAANGVFADPVICSDPLESTKTMKENKACNCTC